MFEIISKIKKLDWFYFSLIFFLSFVGFVMIYSATSGMEYNVLFSHSIKIIFGLFLMLVVAIIDLEFWKKNAFYLYIICMILLIWASFYGHIGKGSRRWIQFSGFYMQPSEFMKICIILSLAKFFDEKQIKDKRDYFFLVLPIAIVLFASIASSTAPSNLSTNAASFVPDSLEALIASAADLTVALECGSPKLCLFDI